MIDKAVIPAIRFREFNDDWDPRKINSLYEKVIEKNDLSYGKDKIISVANMYFRPNNYITDNEYLKTYNVFKLGDIAFEGNKSKHYAHGRFVENTIGDGIVSHVFDVFRPIADYDLLYWKYAINNERLMGNLLIRSTKSSTMMTTLVADDFLKEILIAPRIEEQQQIGRFFDQLDKNIALQRQKVSKIVNIKKAMLDKLFPKDGRSTPEIRIAGFTGEWQKGELVDLVSSFSKGSGYSKGDLKNSGTPIILYGRLYTNYETVIHNVQTFVNARPGYVYSRGGEVIVPASGESSEDISVASVVKDSGVILGGDLNIIIPSNLLDSEFLAISISNGEPRNQMSRLAQGKSVVHLHNSDLEKIELLYPGIDEQQKISSILREFDRTITLHRQKIEKLQKIKMSCFEKMFVYERKITL